MGSMSARWTTEFVFPRGYSDGQDSFTSGYGVRDGRRVVARRVIYQVYPRSFADTNGDGVGDLPGSPPIWTTSPPLGVDAVWLSPFFTSPMKDFGYDVADYCGCRSDVRDAGRFRRPDRPRARPGAEGPDRSGVRPHLGRATPGSRPAASRVNPKADWFVWADAKPDGTPPSNWQSVFGGPAWTWDARRGQYYMHNFLPRAAAAEPAQPGGAGRPAGDGRFWLDRGVDGFRFDAINFAMHDPALTDNPPLPPGGKRTRPFDFQDKIHNQSQPGSSTSSAASAP
jgi:alpha-glucosidase